MEKFQNILRYIRDFMSYNLFDSETLNNTVGTMIAIVLALFLATYFLKWIHKAITAKLPKADKNRFVSIFGFLKYLFHILILITVLSSSGVNLTVLFMASAALFVGLGFALQYLFQDIISGILMILDQSLHVGDIIEVDNKVCRLYEIRLRTTKAVTRDDKVIVIPNHIFLANSIYNYTQNHSTTRESVKVGVACGSDVDLVTNLFLQCAAMQKNILKTPQPSVFFKDLRDSSLLCSAIFFITDSFADPKLKSRIRYLINSKFREKSRNIPFPRRDVHLFQQRLIEHLEIRTCPGGTV